MNEGRVDQNKVIQNSLKSHFNREVHLAYDYLNHFLSFIEVSQKQCHSHFFYFRNNEHL